jgi:hypothetical protein
MSVTISAHNDAMPIARDHGRVIGRKTTVMISNALLRTSCSARVDSARPAALTASQTPYPSAPVIGMRNVASAQYRGGSVVGLMVNTAFCQGVGASGGGEGTGNGGAATDGAGGGGRGTV